MGAYFISSQMYVFLFSNNILITEEQQKAGSQVKQFPEAIMLYSLKGEEPMVTLETQRLASLYHGGATRPFKTRVWW